ncbi:MAG: hypothetical protein HZA78_05940 [Candidatus Schekmanbacteria bacterium]|nr:hypothetical protein [Candidatus Schekmanbacteria bacterium]
MRIKRIAWLGTVVVIMCLGLTKAYAVKYSLMLRKVTILDVSGVFHTETLLKGGGSIGKAWQV